MWPTLHFASFLAAAVLAWTSAARAQDGNFNFGSVERMASDLAAKPFKEPASTGDEMKGLSYDHYRALRPHKDTALWREGKGSPISSTSTTRA